MLNLTSRTSPAIEHLSFHLFGLGCRVKLIMSDAIRVEGDFEVNAREDENIARGMEPMPFDTEISTFPSLRG